MEFPGARKFFPWRRREILDGPCGKAMRGLSRVPDGRLAGARGAGGDFLQRDTKHVDKLILRVT